MEGYKNKNLEGFLKELSSLTEKYGLSIWGCGCCESPCVKDIHTHERFGENLEYCAEKKTYIADEV